MRPNGKTKTKTRVGTVLVFKEGMDKKAAKNAIKQIQHLLERPVDIEEFDASSRGPVWYIP